MIKVLGYIQTYYMLRTRNPKNNQYNIHSGCYISLRRAFWSLDYAGLGLLGSCSCVMYQGLGLRDSD